MKKENEYLTMAKRDALALSKAMKNETVVNLCGRMVSVEEVTMKVCDYCGHRVKKVIRDKWGDHACEKCYYEVVAPDKDYPWTDDKYKEDKFKESVSDNAEQQHYDRMCDGGV